MKNYSRRRVQYRTSYSNRAGLGQNSLSFCHYGPDLQQGRLSVVSDKCPSGSEQQFMKVDTVTVKPERMTFCYFLGGD